MKYVLKVKEMEDDRWPKIYLREIIRRIKNKYDDEAVQNSKKER